MTETSGCLNSHTMFLCIYGASLFSVQSLVICSISVSPYESRILDCVSLPVVSLNPLASALFSPPPCRIPEFLVMIGSGSLHLPSSDYNDFSRYQFWSKQTIVSGYLSTIAKYLSWSPPHSFLVESPAPGFCWTGWPQQFTSELFPSLPLPAT